MGAWPHVRLAFRENRQKPLTVWRYIVVSVGTKGEVPRYWKGSLGAILKSSCRYDVNRRHLITNLIEEFSAVC